MKKESRLIFDGRSFEWVSSREGLESTRNGGVHTFGRWLLIVCGQIYLLSILTTFIWQCILLCLRGAKMFVSLQVLSDMTIF